MNDELVNAKATIVSKLLVIAHYPDNGPFRPSVGIILGESPRTSRPVNLKLGGLLNCALRNSSGSANRMESLNFEGSDHQHRLRRVPVRRSQRSSVPEFTPVLFRELRIRP